jgi:16S rRNA G527 N7-methylase RsmG
MQPIMEAHLGLVLDSVGKKLKALDALMDELQFELCTRHGRVEEIVDNPIHR